MLDHRFPLRHIIRLVGIVCCIVLFVLPQITNAQTNAGVDVVVIMENTNRMPLNDSANNRFAAIEHVANRLADDAIYNHPGAQHRLALITYDASENIRINETIGSFTNPDTGFISETVGSQRTAQLEPFTDITIPAESYDLNGLDSAFSAAETILSGTASNREKVIFVVMLGQSGNRNRILAQYDDLNFMSGNIVLPMILEITNPSDQGFAASDTFIADLEAQQTQFGLLGTPRIYASTDLAEEMTNTLRPLLRDVNPNPPLIRETTDTVTVPPFASSLIVESTEGLSPLQERANQTGNRFNSQVVTGSVTIIESPLPGTYQLNLSDTPANTVITVKMGIPSIDSDSASIPQLVENTYTYIVRDVFGTIINYDEVPQDSTWSGALTVTHQNPAGDNITWNLPLTPTATSGEQVVTFIAPFTGDYIARANVAGTGLPEATVSTLITGLTITPVESNTYSVDALQPTTYQYTITGNATNPLAVTPDLTLAAPADFIAGGMSFDLSLTNDTYQSPALQFINPGSDNLVITASATIAHNNVETTYSLDNMTRIESVTVNAPTATLSVNTVQPIYRRTDVTLDVPEGSFDVASLTTTNTSICLVITDPQTMSHYFKLTANNAGDYETDDYIPTVAGPYTVQAFLGQGATCDENTAQLEEFATQQITARPVYATLVDDNNQPINNVTVAQFLPQSGTLALVYEGADGVLQVLPRTDSGITALNGTNVSLQKVGDNDQYRVQIVAPETIEAMAFDARLQVGDTTIPFWAIRDNDDTTAYNLTVQPATVETTVNPTNTDFGLYQFGNATITTTISSQIEDGDVYDAGNFDTQGGIAEAVINFEQGATTVNYTVPMTFNQGTGEVPPRYTATIPLPDYGNYQITTELSRIQPNTSQTTALTGYTNEPRTIDVGGFELVYPDLSDSPDNPSSMFEEEEGTFALAWLPINIEGNRDLSRTSPFTGMFPNEPTLNFPDGATNIQPRNPTTGFYRFEWGSDQEVDTTLTTTWTFERSVGDVLFNASGTVGQNVSVENVIPLYLTLNGGTQQFYHPSALPWNRNRTNQVLVFDVLLRQETDTRTIDRSPDGIVDASEALDEPLIETVDITVSDADGVPLPDDAYTVEIVEPSDLPEGVRVFIRGINDDTQYFVQATLDENQTSGNYIIRDASSDPNFSSELEYDLIVDFLSLFGLILAAIIFVVVFIAIQITNYRRNRGTSNQRLDGYVQFVQARQTPIWEDSLAPYNAKSRVYTGIRDWAVADIERVKVEAVENDKSSAEVSVWLSDTRRGLRRLIDRYSTLFRSQPDLSEKINVGTAPDNGLRLRMDEQYYIVVNTTSAPSASSTTRTQAQSVSAPGQRISRAKPVVTSPAPSQSPPTSPPPTTDTKPSPDPQPESPVQSAPQPQSPPDAIDTNDSPDDDDTTEVLSDDEVEDMVAKFTDEPDDDLPNSRSVSSSVLVNPFAELDELSSDRDVTSTDETIKDNEDETELDDEDDD